MNLFVGLSAFFLGALHALEPGHGKSAIAAYAVGYRSSLLHILVLGMTTALAHTLTILILAFVLGGAVSTLSTESTQIYVELISSVLLLGTGIWLWRKTSASGKKTSCQTKTGCTCHQEIEIKDKPVSFGVVMLLGISTGLLPCPTALAVLLSSMTAGHFYGGMWTVCLFSIGISLTMCAVAFSSMKFANSKWATKIKDFSGSSSWLRLLPQISAGIIILSGAISLFRFYWHH